MSHDELDRRILHELVQDARASYAEIGAVVGLSAPAVKRRGGRLRSPGAITGFSARLSPGELRRTTQAHVEPLPRGRAPPPGTAAVSPEPPAACSAWPGAGAAA